MSHYPVLDVGGTHVTATRVDVRTWKPVTGSRRRAPLRSDGTADEIVATLVASAASLGPLDGSTLTVAMPGPFDYERGIGRYEHVAKFDALRGVDVRDRLLRALPEPPAQIVFLNDAAAFGIGEWVAGAARQCRRAVAITLGTGVGSAFVDSGAVVVSGPTVPPEGYVHLLRIDGRPLEDVVSRRAIIATYRGYARSDGGAFDVRDIAAMAAAGDAAAGRAIQEPCRALGTALSGWLERFEAEVLVVGGGITASWPLIEPALRAGLAEASSSFEVPVVRAVDPEETTEIGAAWYGVNASGGRADRSPTQAATAP